MVKPMEMPSDAESLRKVLDEKVRQMDALRLSMLNCIVQQLEIDDLADRLDRAVDQDHQTGKLTSERIQQVIAQVRSQHPYE
jgi:hypothetical protein